MANQLGVEEGQIPTHDDGRYHQYDTIDSLMYALRTIDTKGSSHKKPRSARMERIQAKDPMVGMYPNYYPQYPVASASHATPKAKSHQDQFSEQLMSTARKSIFDSYSPGDIDKADMDMDLGTPYGKTETPMVARRDSFDSPMFSPGAGDAGLNKALFSEALLTPFPKTPQMPSTQQRRPSPVRHIRVGVQISPGRSKNNILSGMISPVDKVKVTHSIRDDPDFEMLWNLRGERSEESPEYDDGLPSTTPGRYTQPDLPPMSVDTSRLMKDLATPRTGATASMGDSFFVDDMSPMPLSLTPAMPSESFKRKTAPSVSFSAKRTKNEE